jgi:hypothetical protein
LSHQEGKAVVRTGGEKVNPAVTGEAQASLEFPGSARFGFEWWQIDTGYSALVILEKMGIV